MTGLHNRVVNNKIKFQTCLQAQSSLCRTYRSCPSNSFKVLSQLAHQTSLFSPCSLQKTLIAINDLLAGFVRAGWHFHLKGRTNISCGYQSELAETNLCKTLHGRLTCTHVLLFSKHFRTISGNAFQTYFSNQSAGLRVVLSLPGNEDFSFILPPALNKKKKKKIENP